jgi:hypothetical protein
MKRIYCKEKNTTGASKAHHKGAIGILTPTNNLKAKNCKTLGDNLEA